MTLCSVRTGKAAWRVYERQRIFEPRANEFLSH